MGQVQSLLRRVTAGQAERSPGRQLLAEAIEQHRVAAEAVARIEAAQGRVSTPWEAGVVVDAAKKTVADARDAEARWLVQQMLGEAAGENPVDAAERQLRDAETEYGRVRKINALLAEERTKAQSELGHRVHQRNAAITEIVKSSRAAAALLAAREKALAAVVDLDRVYHFLGQRNALPEVQPARTAQEATRRAQWLYEASTWPDQGGAEPWRKALEALEADADAALPE